MFRFLPICSLHFRWLIVLIALTGNYNHLRLHCSLGKVLVSSGAISTLLGLLAGLIRSRSQLFSLYSLNYTVYLFDVQG